MDADLTIEHSSTPSGDRPAPAAAGDSKRRTAPRSPQEFVEWVAALRPGGSTPTLPDVIALAREVAPASDAGWRPPFMTTTPDPADFAVDAPVDSSGTEAEPELIAATEINPVYTGPGAARQPGGAPPPAAPPYPGPPPGYPQQPGYQGGPGYPPPGYQGQPGYRPQPGYAPQPGYPPQAPRPPQPGYPPAPGYGPQPGYPPPRQGYPPQQPYGASPGYGPPQGYGPPPGYPPPQGPPVPSPYFDPRGTVGEKQGIVQPPGSGLLPEWDALTVQQQVEHADGLPRSAQDRLWGQMTAEQRRVFGAQRMQRPWMQA